MAKSRLAPRGPVRAASPRAQPRPDPTDPDRARMAWEFLRRNPDYRADYRSWRAGAAIGVAERWGLRAPLDPDLRDIDAGAIWRADGAPCAHPPGAARPPEPRAMDRRDAAVAGSPPASARRLGPSCPCGLRDCRMNA
ncbi:transcriptional regulator domain-containing protein [Caulobacter sp. Root1455]|uniref:transcriptional regulator domain-containing protein n=1 Tax=Caulobacter sp. Root1455 TaxID=1736465 RepID=UPI002286228B|nr:DUF6499 domain-containing protein [Caulobacter sp. Root1455]